MFVRTRRRTHNHTVYQYLDIVESVRVNGKVQQRTIGSLGRKEDVTPEKIDGLISHLRKLASPEGLGTSQIGDVEMIASRQYGVVLAVHHL